MKQDKKIKNLCIFNIEKESITLIGTHTPLFELRRRTWVDQRNRPPQSSFPNIANPRSTGNLLIVSRDGAPLLPYEGFHELILIYGCESPPIRHEIQNPRLLFHDYCLYHLEGRELPTKIFFPRTLKNVKHYREGSKGSRLLPQWGIS